MTRSFFYALFLGPLAVCATAAGCSDDPEPTPVEPPAEAGIDAPQVIDTGTPETGPTCDGDILGDGIARHLRCAGLYSDFAQKTIAADAKEFKPGVEFWSDGATKKRWIQLPANSKIDTANMDEWIFPAGTKLWKEFALGGKRVETRLYVKTSTGWSHTTYRWNADETDAERKDQGEKIAGLGPDGGVYEIPSTGQCDVCHNGRKEPVLGFEAVSLGLPTATGQTLATLASEGTLTAPPAKTALTFPEDSTNKAAAALGWVHANCGSCHNANEGAGAVFRAHFLVRASQLGTDAGDGGSVNDLDLWTQGYCRASSRPTPDGGGGTDAGNYYIIKGGAPDESLMHVLASQRAVPPDEPSSSNQMPPLVTHAVDVNGIKQFTDWIAALPPCP